MAYFSATDFDVFTEPRSLDPGLNLERVRLRDALADLHDKIYPEIRSRRWDLHPHWVPRYLISTARLEPPLTRIDHLLLRYSKAETVVRLMKKELGEDFLHPLRTALLGVRLDASGLAVELMIGERATADGENFKNKLVKGPPEKRHVRQLFAELGPDYALTLQTPTGDELAHIRCARLVNVGMLDAVAEKFAPGAHALRVSILYSRDDPRIAAATLPGEILLRLSQLYLLYQFVNWSPRNDFLSKGHPRIERTDKSGVNE